MGYNQLKVHMFVIYYCSYLFDLVLELFILYCPLLVVSMPSEQYSLELLNGTVASLDRAVSRVTGMIIGSTEIVLHDKSREEGKARQINFYFYFFLDMLNIPHAAKPSADIHVVFPHHIGTLIL